MKYILNIGSNEEAVDSHEKIEEIVYNIEELKYSIKKIHENTNICELQILKAYYCYKMVEKAKNDGLNILNLDNYIFFIAMGCGHLLSYVNFNYDGYSNWNDFCSKDVEKSIEKINMNNLRFLLGCLYDTDCGRKLLVNLSDISSKLNNIFSSNHAIKVLKETRDMEYAYYSIGGELKAGIHYLDKAMRHLESFNGRMNRVMRKGNKEDKKKVIELINCTRAVVNNICSKIK